MTIQYLGTKVVSVLFKKKIKSIICVYILLSPRHRMINCLSIVFVSNFINKKATDLIESGTYKVDRGYFSR